MSCRQRIPREIYYNYYKNQRGNGGYPVFRGSLRQKGYGVGNLISKAVRFVTPYIKKALTSEITKQGAKYLGKEAIGTGKDLWKDVVVDKKKLKTSIKERGKQRIGGMKRKAAETLFDEVTRRAKVQKGSGVKRQQKATSKRKSRNIKQRKRHRDIFS